MEETRIMKIVSIKNFFSKKTVKIILVALAISAAGFGLYKSPIVQKTLTAASTTAVQQKTVTVKKGDLNSVVSGSSSVYYDRVTKVASKVSSTVSKIYFQQGDVVKAGDLIAEFDDIDAQQTVNDKENTLLQNQLSNEATLEDVRRLTVKIPFAGQVSDIKVKSSDTVSKGAALFTITDTSKLKVLLQFNGADAAKITVNQSADVYLTSMMQSVKGTVKYISSQPAATTQGGQLHSVEIEVDNPGAVLGGMTASAEIETTGGVVTSTNTAVLEYIKKATVTSEVSGTVDAISIKENQKANSGEPVIKLKSDEIIRSAQLAEMKIANSKDQVASANQQLNYYKIYAPIDGVISLQAIKVGDSVKTDETITTITETSVMEFDINIDELDIAKISVEQKATITVDALTETAAKPLQGEVIKVAFQGTSSNGVTTFPVTVRIHEGIDKIKGGMNATANIQVGKASGVLYLPIEAIAKSGGKSYVWVKADGASADGTYKNSETSGNTTSDRGQNKGASNNSVQNGPMGMFGIGTQNKTSSQSQNYYANAVRKEVQVGINNDSYIEIKSGLNEGDVIILPQIQISTTNNNQGRVPGGAPTGGGRS
jgi:HlyD family secretion protein